MHDEARTKQLASLWASATAALARREHSEMELRQKLKAKAQAYDLLDEVIDALLQDDLLSDERFAQMLCQSRFNKGVGPVRLEYELNQHHIKSQWSEAAMAQFEHSWHDRLAELKIKKYGKMPPRDYVGWAKQARFFQQRGFTLDQIQGVIPRC